MLEKLVVTYIDPTQTSGTSAWTEQNDRMLSIQFAHH